MISRYNFLRFFSYSIIALIFGYLLNNILTVWYDWPGVSKIFSELKSSQKNLSFIQVLIYFASLIGILIYIFKTKKQTLEKDSKILSSISAYLIRSAFWAVFLLGIIDLLISFLAVEKFLEVIFNENIKFKLIAPQFRITFVHLPIILLSFVIGFFTRTTGFIWLAVLVVFSEFSIVLSRFIFSYEQAFQGDLVRFWYAALFLFASAYALIHEGHVRVDVLYTGFSEKKKAWTNCLGSILLGAPLCLIVIFLGMHGKASIINSPILSFEVTQQGSNGLYLKYLMAGYLGVFAVSMLLQFISYFMNSSHQILKNLKR